MSYVDKNKFGKENDVVLSTMYAELRITKDELKTSSVHAFYDHTKGGVDAIDLVSSHNTTKMKVKQWPVIIISFLLDTVRMNAKTILPKSENAVNLSLRTNEESCSFYLKLNEDIKTTRVHTLT